jgi:AcrR family transcriptional regulator
MLDLPHTDAYVKPMRHSRKLGPVPRDTAKQQTREALVSAALELFVEQGLDAPSLDAICERAGYTRGAFYVHFADRDALLVAAMEKVGEAFLASVFSGLRRPPESVKQLVSAAGPTSALAEVVERFIGALAAGAYPLMQGAERGSATRRAPSRARAKAGPLVRPHQLIEACARSPVVRERYRALVDASVDRLADLATADQAAGSIRSEVDARSVGTLFLALVIGAQTMAELGVAVDPAALGQTVVGILRS